MWSLASHLIFFIPSSFSISICTKSSCFLKNLCNPFHFQGVCSNTGPADFTPGLWPGSSLLLDFLLSWIPLHNYFSSGAGADWIRYHFPYMVLRLWLCSSTISVLPRFSRSWPLGKRGCYGGISTVSDSQPASRRSEGSGSPVTHFEFILGSSKLSNVDSIILWPSVELT